MDEVKQYQYWLDGTLNGFAVVDVLLATAR
jgi:hypothetical protein